MKFDRKTAKDLFLRLNTKQQNEALVLCGFDLLTLKAITLKHFENWTFQETVEILYHVKRTDIHFDNYVDKYKRLKRKAFQRMADVFNTYRNEEYTRIYWVLFSPELKN